MPFLCSICGEESTRICKLCTKDSCNNHLCERCGRCSDCCECEVALVEESKGPSWGSARAAVRAVAESKIIEPQPPRPEEPPGPDPDPEPSPEQEPQPGPLEV